MSLPYQHELDFSIKVLEKMHLSVRLVHPCDSQHASDVLHTRIGSEDADQNAYWIASRCAKEQTIYRIADQFTCNYLCFHLPETETPTAVVLGPYLTIDPKPEDVLKTVERLRLPMSVQPQLSDYYASLPVYHDPSGLLSIVTSLAEHLWRDKKYELIDVNHEQQMNIPDTVSIAAPLEQESILQRMQQLEERYAYESTLMDVVSKGLLNQAESMMSNISRLNYQPRVSDPLRNMKNYCIVCNTLLRKAAQQGGVHPLHLDRTSSRFARTIETSSTLENCSELIIEMLRSYCRLVRTHAGRQYSATVHNVLTYIVANLSGDLSLATLSRLMQVTPSYLSTLFHRETGTTLADYITAQRMQMSLQLLQTTHLQVQNIAQLSGYSDPGYFGKAFKRYYGFSPQHYRREHHSNVPLLKREPVAPKSQGT